MIAMAPPRPSRPAAHPQPADGDQPRPAVVSSAADPDGQLRHSRFRLTPGLVAASEAREHVRAVIRAWHLLVDADVAVLLASELVANAITHGQSGNSNGNGELPGAQPLSSMLADAMQAGTVPADAVPADAVPADAVPADAVPADAVPVNSGPVDTEPIMLSIQYCRGELRVEVHDRSRDMPAPSAENTSPESETGRGLMLVAALAAKWGFYRTSAGKAAYFTLPVYPASPG